MPHAALASRTATRRWRLGRRTAGCAALLLGILALAPLAPAQIRVTPASARGGVKFGEPWARVPPAFRESIRFPAWEPPADLAAWQANGRAATRATLLQLLGELPPRPAPPAVRVTRRERRDDHDVEFFEFFNGVDLTVTGALLLPRNAPRRVPAIIALHTWSGTKEDLLLDARSYENVGPTLVRAGYVVAAIDGCFHGERIGRGPNDPTTPPGQSASAVKQRQQQSLSGLYLWQGRTLWGMMLREQQCLVDYLQTRPEVDAQRIGATGMSLGNTTAWWLAALDDRIKVIVGVACFTRLEQLIAHGQVQAHGLYYFVPGMLRHFDTEAVFSVVAPRPMLQLNGDGDTTCPPDGIEILERKVGDVYRLHDLGDNFRSILYRDTGHEYLPEMKAEMLRWFQKHLPVDSLRDVPRTEVTR